jgi:hypothetical protein
MTHLITVLLSALVAALTTLIVQSRGIRIWEAQERWKFKADVYAQGSFLLGAHEGTVRGRRHPRNLANA